MSITAITGPMFGGKSTELAQVVRRQAYKRRSCVLVIPRRDKRYTEDASMVTHDRTAIPAVRAEALADVRTTLDAADVIAIDEGHFFEDLEAECTRLARLGKMVVVAALDTDYRGEPFAGVARLVARAEYHTKRHAVCEECQQDAAFTRRTDATNAKTPTLDVGGKDKYAPVCRAHHPFLAPTPGPR